MQAALTLSPAATAARCLARTHFGSPCRSPPLRSSRFCWFHDEQADVRAARTVARKRGGSRRVSGPNIAGLPDLVFERPEQLTRFQTAVLAGLLRGEIGSLEARTAVEISRRIHESAAHPDNDSVLAGMSSLLAEIRGQVADAAIDG